MPSPLFFASLIAFYVASHIGYLADTVSAATTLTFFAWVRLLFTDANKALPVATVRSIVNLIRSGRLADIGLSTLVRVKANVTLADVTNLMLYFLGPTRHLRHPHTRVVLVALTLYLVATANRVGSVLKGSPA